jgi:hypothetical protein
MAETYDETGAAQDVLVDAGSADLAIFLETGHTQVITVPILRHGVVIKLFRRGRVGRKSEFRNNHPDNVIQSGR